MNMQFNLGQAPPSNYPNNTHPQRAEVRRAGSEKECCLFAPMWELKKNLDISELPVLVGADCPEVQNPNLL